MTSKFDQFMGKVLGENNLMAATPKTTPPMQSKPVPGAAPTTPTPNQNNQQANQQQQPDPEMDNAFKMLMTKTQDPKHQEAIQALQQLLIQQQNATNKPA